MPCVHGLEHIEGFTTTDFTDDDSVWSHAQGVAHQITDADFAMSVYIWGFGFKAYNMVLLQLKLCCVLNGDDSLIRRNETGHEVE